MKGCRTCKFWKLSKFWVENDVTIADDMEFPCTKLQDVIDIDLSRRGWDGYSEIDEIWTRADWGCKSHKERGKTCSNETDVG